MFRQVGIISRSSSATAVAVPQRRWTQPAVVFATTQQQQQHQQYHCCRRLFSSGASMLCLDKVKTYHDVLCMPFDVVIDTVVLQKNYHNLQRSAHPDVIAAAKARREKEQQQQQQKEGTSSSATSAASSADPEPEPVEFDSREANKAYETLKDPYLRCRYVSQLLRALRTGQRPPVSPAAAAASSSSSSSFSAADWAEMKIVEGKRNEKGSAAALPPMPPEFLMEIMDLNEEVNEVDTSDEASATEKERVVEVKKTIEEKCEEYWAEAQKIFVASDMRTQTQLLLVAEQEQATTTPGGDTDLTSVSDEVAAAEREFHLTCLKWTYYYNLKKQLLDRS